MDLLWLEGVARGIHLTYAMHVIMPISIIVIPFFHPVIIPLPLPSCLHQSS